MYYRIALPALEKSNLLLGGLGSTVPGLIEVGDGGARQKVEILWQRDLLRVKGGITDYCVIGEIDVQALRQFQSSHRSPTKPFKPVPDGFEIDFGRRQLPQGE